MKLLDWIRGRKPAVTRTITYGELLRHGLIDPPTAAGIAVTPGSALACSPVFAAVRVISTAIAGLPLCVYQKQDDDSRVRATTHPAHWVIHEQPNGESDPFVFWASFVVQMLLHGTGYAEIEWAGNGSPAALWLLPSDKTKPKRTAAGELYYEATVGGRAYSLLPEDVFCVPYFSLDGVCGKGVIEYAKEAIGLNKAMEGGAAAFFANMTRPSGAIEVPTGFSEIARENLRKSLLTQHSGTGNVGRLMLLEDGAKYNPFSVSNTDAQWIEGRGFGIQEVARFFSISPTKLADLGRATWSNLGSENLSFIETTLRSILTPIEQQCNTKLIAPASRGRFFVEAVIEARLRGLTAERYAAYSTAIAAGFMLPSEARRMENWPAIPGIDDRPRPGSAPPPPATDPKPPDESHP